MSVSERTYYEVLDTDPRAPKAEVKSAYTAALEAAQARGDAEEVAAIRRAWQVLSDPVQRQRYDEQIGIVGGAAPPRVDRGEDDRGQDDADEADREVDGDADLVEVEAGPGAEDGADGVALRAGGPRIGPDGVPEYLEQPTIGRRLTASLIDVITTVALFTAASAIAVAALDSDTARFVALVVIYEVLVLALFVVPTIRTGQTLGKRLTYVVCVDRATGYLPTVAQVVRRYLVPMAVVPAFLQFGAFLALFFGLSYAMGRDQLSLADRLARTIVVVARYRPTRPRAGTAEG